MACKSKNQKKCVHCGKKAWFSSTKEVKLTTINGVIIRKINLFKCVSCKKSSFLFSNMKRG